MERKVMIWTAVGIVAVLCIAAGAWFLLQDDDDQATGDITVTDMRGRTVVVPSDVDEIVCLSAGSVRLVTYMGAQDMIIGVDDMDKGLKGPPAKSPRWYQATYRLVVDTSAIPCVGSEENFKAIMETGADLIITSQTDASELDTLQQTTGIPVVAVMADGNITVDDSQFRDNIRLLGKVLGKESRADELINGVDSMIKDLRGKASKVTNKPTAYIGGMFFMMEGNLYKTTGNYIPMELAGVINVMPDKNGTPYDTSIKEIVASGADYMFLDCITLKDSKEIFEKEKDTLSELDAVRDGNIYSTYTYKFYGTNWESELMNAYFIGSTVNPQAYGSDWETNVNKVLDLFYPAEGIDTGKVADKQAPGASKLNW